MGDHKNVAPSAMSAQQVHDSYVSLQKVERDFRTQTGRTSSKPVFSVRKSRSTFCSET